MMNRNETSIFTKEQLERMSPENLRKVVMLMQNHKEKVEQEQSVLKQEVQLLKERNAELEFMYALMADKYAAMQRKRFGSSSEKYADGYEQLGLFNEAEATAEPEAAEPEFEEIVPKPYKRKKQKGKKEDDLSKFPVGVAVENKLEGEAAKCPHCGSMMKAAAKEIRKFLKFVPAHFEVIEETTYVYSCPNCSAMKRADKENALLKGSIATPSLVAGIMNAKYVQGMPLDRQSREFARYDLVLSTKTMANWMIACADRYLKPLFDEMKKEFLKCRYIQCDETRIQVLDEPEQKSETKNWMWAYMTGRYQEGPRMILFDYERTRGGYHPKEFLDGIGECYATCDGYQPYHGLPGHITVTGCMAHARRRFEEVLTIMKKEFTKEQLKETTAYQAMARIGMLYQIEALLADQTPEERYAERQKQAAPLLDAFFEWLHTLEGKVNRSTKIGEAVLYTLNQETYLRRYLEDGHIPIDNNDCERSLKNFAIGRRNWLFAKSIRGAQASAIIYSITETAMLNGLKPYNYLTYVLDEMRRLPDFASGEAIQKLLPWSPTIPGECKTQLKK